MNWKHFLPLAMALLFGLCFALGTRGLNEPDEGRYANMAGEILEADGHGWWTPVLADVPHYDKPPLIYWTTALSFKLFGQNETAARLPSLLGALLTLTGLGWAAWRLHGATVAWWSLLVGGTLTQFWALARWLTPDMLLTGWVTLALAALVECRHRNGAWRWWWLSLTFWAAAWWTKATPALVPLLGWYVALWVTGDRAGRRATRLPLLLPLIILLGAPWYALLMLERPDLADFFLGRELAGRMTGHADGRHGPVFYYAVVSAAAWLPWWPWALAAAKIKQWSAGWWRRAPELWLTVSGLLVFTLTSSKLPTYTLTLAPWVALGMARLLAPLAVRWRGRLLATAGLWLALMLAAALLVTPHESRLGRNSSMREVAAYLKEQGARRVYADDFWPGLDFYFGEETFFVTKKSIVQRRADEPVAAAHFLTREQFAQRPPAPDEWLVHYARRQLELPAPHRKLMVIGDFELYLLE